MHKIIAIILYAPDLLISFWFNPTNMYDRCNKDDDKSRSNAIFVQDTKFFQMPCRILNNSSDRV